MAAASAHAWLQACGTLDFMAPEMLADEPAYGATADVWSAGVLVYMLLSGSHPFRGPSQCATEERIKAGRLPSDRPGEGLHGVSAEARAFVKALLVRPGARLSAKEALGHPWLRLQRNNADAPLLDAGVPAKVKELVETGAAAQSNRPPPRWPPRSAGPLARPALLLSGGPRGAPSPLGDAGGETAMCRAPPPRPQGAEATASESLPRDQAASTMARPRAARATGPRQP